MERKMRNYPLILLCGGKSVRMGSPKGLLEISGSLLFLEQIKQFQKGGGANVVIVLGYHPEMYMNNICWTNDLNDDKWIEHDGINLAIVRNQNPHHGQFSSIICALERLIQDDFPGAFVMPVDMLPPKKNTWKALINNMYASIDVCIPSWKGSGGHPVLLSNVYIRTLLKVPKSSPDARLDYEIKTLPQDSIKYVVTNDNRITGNVNTLPEFKALKSGY